MADSDRALRWDKDSRYPSPPQQTQRSNSSAHHGTLRPSRLAASMTRSSSASSLHVEAAPTCDTTALDPSAVVDIRNQTPGHQALCQPASAAAAGPSLHRALDTDLASPTPLTTQSRGLSLKLRPTLDLIDVTGAGTTLPSTSSHHNQHLGATTDNPTSFTSALSPTLPTEGVSGSTVHRRRLSSATTRRPSVARDASPFFPRAAASTPSTQVAPSSSLEHGRLSVFDGPSSSHGIATPQHKQRLSDTDFDETKSSQATFNTYSERKRYSRHLSAISSNAMSSSPHFTAVSMAGPSSSPRSQANDAIKLVPMSSAPSDATPSYTSEQGLSDPGAGSPRTSTSTSSSPAGSWAVPYSYSDSDSSADELSSVNKGGWWQHDETPGRTQRSRPKTYRQSNSSRRLPAGLRRWGWLLGPLQGVLLGPQRGEGRRTVQQQQRRTTILGSKTLAKACDYVDDEPWVITLGVVSFLFFALFMTCTIKYILDPDKDPVPWREYCSAEYPTLFSLKPEISTFELQPILPNDTLWPYPGHKAAPYNEALNATAVDGIEPVSILVGVLTTAWSFQRRNLIRQSYASHHRSRAAGTEGVNVKFIMGRPGPAHARAVELEMETHDDIVILDIQENMNSGKTHAYFSWAASSASVPDYEYPDFPRTPESKAEFDRIRSETGATPAPILRGERRPHYVAKADDDAFIMLGEMEKRLRATPRSKTFWGYMVRREFIAGECYAMSLDLTEYVRDEPKLRQMIVGKEDKLTSKWMKLHPERENITWASERCWIYDHPKAKTVYSHGFLFPDEVARSRAERAKGLPEHEVDLRGGRRAEAFSTVSTFATPYTPPMPGLSMDEQVEALVEGSGMSRLRDLHNARWLPDIRQRVQTLMSQRPSRAERFLGDQAERGGTVVVHFIKRHEWFVDTIAALLGPAETR